MIPEFLILGTKSQPDGGIFETGSSLHCYLNTNARKIVKTVPWPSRPMQCSSLIQHRTNMIKKYVRMLQNQLLGLMQRDSSNGLLARFEFQFLITGNKAYLLCQ